MRLVGLNPLASTQAAGILVSTLGAWAGCAALYLLLRLREEEETARRAVFYVLIFPAGFFLTQIYSEGLFFGLALLALYWLDRDRPLLAACAALLASGTRPIGMALVIPFAIRLLPPLWASLRGERQVLLSNLQRSLLCAAPLVLPLGLQLSPWGTNYRIVEKGYFSRAAFSVGASLEAWRKVLADLSFQQPDTLVYYLLEIAAIALSLAACLVLLRRYPGLALFGAACMLIPLTSGMPQSFLRYALHVYAMFIVLARWGRSWWFDRLWTLGSLLLMGLLLTLFTFNFWVA